MTKTLLILFSLVAVHAAPKKPATAKAAKKDNMSFDSQVVEGEIYRPDYSVVTGEAPGEGWGVLRLRSNFKDHTATDSEEIKR